MDLWGGMFLRLCFRCHGTCPELEVYVCSRYLGADSVMMCSRCPLTQQFSLFRPPFHQKGIIPLSTIARQPLFLFFFQSLPSKRSPLLGCIRKTLRLRFLTDSAEVPYKRDQWVDNAIALQAANTLDDENHSRSKRDLRTCCLIYIIPGKCCPLEWSSMYGQTRIKTARVLSLS